MATKHRKRAIIAHNEDGKRVISISFPFDTDLLDKVRTLPGRLWHPQDRVWSTPILIDTIKKLIDWGFEIDDKLQHIIVKNRQRKIELENIGVPGLIGTPYPYQSQGITLLEQRNGRALLADEMGLGKTIQALGWIQLHRDRVPVIIVCPAFLKFNWLREINKWLPNPDAHIVKGTKPYTIKNDIIIINYDILPYWVKELRLRSPQILITDECHFYKSTKAKRTKAVVLLSKTIPHIIALSGTPIENKPAELYTAINIIAPELFPKQWFFLQRYCEPKHNGFGWSFNGATNINELYEKLTSTIMIRRKKVDVLPDLPEKTWAYVPIELNNQKEYDEAESDFIEWVKKEKGLEAAQKASNAEVFASLSGLKQLAVKGKLNQSIEWIESFIQSGKKLVVFAHHHFVIDALMSAFNDIAVKVDGRVSMIKREDAVTAFQTNPMVKLFIGNIEAAGVGLTLTAASDVVFLELPWTPGKLEQASDRVHRIGQTNKVTIYYLLANNTIEDRVATIIDKKRRILDGVLDGMQTEENTLLIELIKTYEK